MYEFCKQINTEKKPKSFKMFRIRHQQLEEKPAELACLPRGDCYDQSNQPLIFK